MYHLDINFLRLSKNAKSIIVLSRLNKLLHYDYEF